MILAYNRRAARYLAISSRKSLWALKKNDNRGANESTGNPAATAASTYAMALAKVKATSCASDLTSPAGAGALVTHAVDALGGVDILIHSAGIWPVEEVPVAALDDARWARTMRENVDAMFFVARAALRVMGSGGRMVFVSSTAGQRGESMHADYGASKGAMISFVKSLAVEVAGQGITVNAVAPGWVDTEMCVVPFADGGKERIAKGIPVGRIASAYDVAFPAVCLCLPGARHVTGEIVNVNGGSVLCG